MKIIKLIFHKTIRLLDRLSYRSKLMFSFFIAITIPIMAISITTYYVTTSLMENQVEYSFSQTLNQVQNNVDRRTKQIKEVCDLINQDYNIRKILTSSSKKKLYDELEDFEYMDKYFRFLEDNFKIYRIRLYMALNTSYSDEGHRFFNITSLDTTEGISSSIPNYTGAILWKPTYYQHYKNNGSKYVVSAVSVIKDYTSLKICGIYFIDILEEELYKSIEDITGKDGTITTIIDSKGIVVSSKDKAYIGKYYDAPFINRILEKREGSFKYNNHLILFKRLDTSNMILVSDIPLAVIKSKTFIITKITIIITILALVCSILLSRFLSNSLSRKLNYLLKAMKKRKNSDNEELPQEVILPDTLSYSDEIGRLIATYNNMVSRIKKLIDEVYVVKLHQSETKFKMLQEQINPHFLYNILESMKSLIASRKLEKANELIISLAKFYRVALSKGKDKITIDKELDMVKLYVYMQNTCYRNKFELIIDIDEDILPFLIVKFTLQPLVENAIKHGLAQKKGNGTIIIKGRFCGDDIIVEVLDDGVGIECNSLNKIQKELEEGIIMDGKGYGLYNVNARLRVYQSKPYGLSIFSKPGEGTTVEVFIPREV